MLTGPTDVSNLALAELGARRIADYQGDATTEARACRRAYDITRDTLLRGHQWNFATARAALTLHIDPPAQEWTEAWALPVDMVRFIRIAGYPVAEFAIEGRRLLTAGMEDISIVYVTNATPLPEWDVLFTEALTLKLAAAIAPDVTQNPALAEAALAKLSRLTLPAAWAADARESLSGENYGPTHAAARSGLVAARFRQDGRPPYTPGAGRTVELP